MKKPLQKIAIIFLIILLPVIYLSFHELSSLNENEKSLEAIYNQQLDAILFSVNQYSEDIINSWISKINFSIQANRKSEIQKLISENPINGVFTGDTLNLKSTIVFEPSVANPILHNSIYKTLLSNQTTIKRLYNYRKTGYRKIESLKIADLENKSILLFLENGTEGNFYGIIVDRIDFIKKILAPKLQEISQNEFVISVSGIDEGNIYSTDNTEFSGIQQKKPIWLFPDMNLGIMMKGASIQNLIKSRTQFNLYLILLIIFVLLIGFWFLYSNLRKEIKLAQIKSDFVSNVSHELRTPLSLISMFSETLELGRVKSEEKKQEYYSIISHETTRLSRIVNKILNFSKMEAGKIKYNLEPANINSVVEKILTNYSFHLQNKGFKFDLEKTENLPLVNLDSEAISEAIINLIDNSIKYSNR